MNKIKKSKILNGTGQLMYPCHVSSSIYNVHYVRAPDA